MHTHANIKARVVCSLSSLQARLGFLLARTQRLKRKAEERNPDEFYFAMEKARTKNGVHDGR